jgi:hypothetical protein
MKKHLLILVLLMAGTLAAAAPDRLEMLIQQKDWPALAALFSDDSHQQVAAYFAPCQRVVFGAVTANDVMFFARFRDQAEIGEISFETENGAYSKLSLKRNIKPLHFVDSFVGYAVDDRTIRIGDAEIVFRKGTIYQGRPMANFYIFAGDWTFRIRPDDEEERLTLRYLVKDERFEKDAQAGVFIYNGPDLTEGLTAQPAPADLQDEEARLLYDVFQKRWGMRIPVLDELWYFPFAADFYVAMFYQKPGKSYFRYIFNAGGTPDTTLVLFPENRFYLNYNALKGLKLTAQAVDELDKMRLNLFYNPQMQFLSGTAILKYKNPTDVKTVALDPGLVVRSYSGSDQHDFQLFQREDTYFLLGHEIDRFGFYYNGHIRSGEEGGDQSRYRVERQAGNREPLFILDRDQNFYPNPGPHFFKNRLTISLPASMHCLASGSLRAQETVGDRNVFVFESPGSKGISLACGSFKRLMTVPSRIPIQVYGNAKLRLDDYVSADEVKAYFDFLLEKFGPLDIPELNLLMRRYRDYGGWSNQGFIVFNLLDSAVFDNDLGEIRRIRRDSPVILTDINRDSLVHELAHQWWGGVVSWKTYQDQWLTEGLAQFSMLLFLQDTLSEGHFRKVLGTVKKWAQRKSDAGPVIYGWRIANLSNDLQTYQSIVYNKAALVFLMLKEMLGEPELLARLRQVLAEFKYESLTSARFIQQFSQTSPRLRKFFRGWVYSRRIPDVSYQVSVAGTGARIDFSQKNGDFVFPVSVRVETSAGVMVRTLVVEEKSQTFTLSEDAPIQSIEVEALAAPVDLHG